MSDDDADRVPRPEQHAHEILSYMIEAMRNGKTPAEAGRSVTRLIAERDVAVVKRYARKNVGDAPGARLEVVVRDGEPADLGFVPADRRGREEATAAELYLAACWGRWRRDPDFVRAQLAWIGGELNRPDDDKEGDDGERPR